MEKNNKEPKITISFPIYNVEKTVRQSLLTALNQTYQNIEILAIDDCGSDNSMEVFEDTISNHPRGNIVRLIHHEQNTGLGSVRNTSIDNASGEYIYFMDSDDLLETDAIEKLVRIMVTTHVDFVASSFLEVKGKTTIEHRYRENQVIKGDSILRTHYSMEPIQVYMWNKLIRLDLLKDKRIKCIHPYVEDDMFTFNLLACSKSCYKCTDLTYRYVVREDSLTQRLMSERLPAKTAKIYLDIIRRKLSFARELVDEETIASLISIYVLNSAFLRLTEIENSVVIDKGQKHEIETALLKEISRKNLFFSIKAMTISNAIKYLTILIATFLNSTIKKKYILFIQNLKRW